MKLWSASKFALFCLLVTWFFLSQTVLCRHFAGMCRSSYRDWLPGNWSADQDMGRSPHTTGGRVVGWPSISLSWPTHGAVGVRACIVVSAACSCTEPAGNLSCSAAVQGTEQRHVAEGMSFGGEHGQGRWSLSRSPFRSCEKV